MKTSNNEQALAGLTAIRNALGFTQELMAIFLKINISTLKMAEAGNRALPTNAFIKVAALEIQLCGKTRKTRYENFHPDEQLCPSAFKEQYFQLISKEKKCAYDSILLERKLEAMPAIYWKARKRLQVIEELIRENKYGEFDSATWQRQKDAAISMLNKSGQAQQVLLKSKIDMLQAEIELCKKAKLQIRETIPGLFKADDDTLLKK